MIYEYPKSTVPLLPAEKSTLTAEENYKMPLIKQVPNLVFDIKQLEKEVKEIAENYEPIFPYLPFNVGKNKYGGWSLTSNDGDWKSGWETGSAVKNGQWDKNLALKQGYKSKNGRFSQTIKTELYKGHLAEVVEAFKNLGFFPIAVRIWTIPPNGHHIGIHTDAPANMYSVRIHIPLLVNDNCVSIWYNDDHSEKYRTQLKATGHSFMFKTNTLHDGYNNDEKLPRYHLIFEGWDTKDVVGGYKFNHLEKLIHYIKLDNPEITKENILYGLI